MLQRADQSSTNLVLIVKQMMAISHMLVNYLDPRAKTHANETIRAIYLASIGMPKQLGMEVGRRW